MRPGSAPSLVNPVMLFQQATCTNLQLSSGTHKHSIKGSLSKDGKVCWMYSGSILEVVATDTQNRLAAWNFGIMLHDSEVVIQCVAEFWAGDSLRLLVGLKNSSIAGLVCVLNVNLSRVVKAIEIPFKVTSIECITSLLGNDFPVWAFSEHLSCFYGIVAVGTEGGHVYLIDMCLDTQDQSDEMFPNTLHYISADTEDVVQTRHEALSQRQVLCMELGVEFFSLGSFNYHSNDESEIKQLKTDEICVTCLKYMSRNGLLAVGYNFGCFQLWRLSAPVLEYSSRLDDSGNVPITHIAYQEPENDPKNFSYLWVARGSLVYSSEEGYMANITLYQLSFNKRMWYSNKECFYEEMSTIGIRLEHDLSCDPLNSPSSKMASSNVISCYTVEDPYFFLPVRSIDESQEETSCNPDLSLCVFVWRADNGLKSGTTSYHLAIFDMNRWYHAQMPSNIRMLGNTGICPYMAFCSLDEVIDTTIPDELLFAHINPNTVRKFISDPGLIQEQFFYPSSLQFDVLCLMESGLVNARYLGMQRQVLSTIQKLGPSSLIDPNELYKMCLFAGLAPRSHDAATHTFSLTNYNREAILTLCLEHHLVNVITKSVEQWADGEFLSQGCTLKFLLDWTWNKVVQIKQCVDNTCKPFYDWSGLPVDERCVQILHHCLQKLLYLTHILQKFIHTSAPITENGIEELTQKFDAVQLLSHHLKAVIWFVESGLLPENDELASYIPGLYRYPRTSLIEVFMKRREELQQLHSDVKASELLMIDGLIENTAPAVRELWQQDGGDGQYPPPSINALINFYLLDDVPLLIKHCVISYFLLDLASLEDDNNVKLSEKVATFADVFSVPSDTMNLITGFWLLDHKDFEVAFSFLVNSPVFGPWQHKQVIKALLYQNEGKLALRYLAVKQPPLSSPEEVKLKLTTFLVNGMTAQAVEFQRTCCDQNNAQDLISHIFLGCQQTKTMDQLLKLPLTDLEEKWLENYLLTSMESHSEELLVMYYLQRARFVDAIRLNERLNTKAFGMISAKDRERASTRNTIVNGCAKLLPEVQQQLIFEPAVLPRRIKKDIAVPRPKPLSTMVTKSNPSKLISQSTFVLAVMEKMQEVAQVEDFTSNGSFNDDFRQRPVEPFISTPITPKKRTPLSDLSKVVYERNLLDEQKAPRLRLSPSSTPPMAASLFSYGMESNKRSSKYVSAEALSVLQTPIIHRKSTPRSHVTSPRPTPQSILKVRQISNKSPNMHGVSPLSIGDKDKDVPDTRSALRLAKLNLSLNDSVGQPFGASAKKTKLLRFAEPALNSSPVSVQDSPTPSSSHAFPSVTARASLTERKSLSEMISTENCPISETVENDETLEMDTEMMEEEVDAVGTKEDNVEERAYMVTDTKDDDISDEISNSIETEANESREEEEEEEEEEDEEAMEVVEEEMPIVTHMEHPVREVFGSMHFQRPDVPREDTGILKNTVTLADEQPELLVYKGSSMVIPDYSTSSSKPIDLTIEEEEEEEEEFKPLESADILELAPLRQKSKLSEKVEEYNSNETVSRLMYEEKQEIQTDQFSEQYMEEDVPEEKDEIAVEVIESERDDIQIITAVVLPIGQHISQELNEATSVNSATKKDVDIVEVEEEEEDEEQVVVVVEEEEAKEQVVELEEANEQVVELEEANERVVELEEANERVVELEEAKERVVELEEKELAKEQEEEEEEEKEAEVVEEEENKIEIVKEGEEKRKMIEMEKIPKVKAGRTKISKSLTITDLTPEPADLSAPPSHSTTARNSSRSASPQSISSPSLVYTRRSLRSKVKAESMESNRSEAALVPATTESVSELISMPVDMTAGSVLESASDEVVSQTFSTHSSKFASPKSSESRSTRKKASQKSLKSKLESIKKDLLEEASNQRNDSSVKNWQEEEQTMTELVSPSRTKAKVSAKNEAISSEISKLEEEEEEEVEDDYSSIKTRSLRSSRSVTLTRRSSRLKTETSLRGATPTQTTPLSEVDSPQASTPPRRLGAPQTSTPLREVGASRTSTPPREVATSRPSTPPRDIGPSRTSTLRVLPVRTSTPTRGEQLSKVSDEKESSSPLLVNIKIKNQDESKVEMEETVPEFEPQVRTTRRITRKAAALQSQSELTANTESDESDLNNESSPALHIKSDVNIFETPSNQQKPFVFSPPITRKKTQKKQPAKKNLKTDSSIIFSSTRSQRSTLKKEPFVPQEQEEMSIDIPMEESLIPAASSSSKTYVAPVKTRSTRQKVYLVKTTDSPIVNLLTPSRHKTEHGEKETTRTAQSRILRKPAHSMVLRTKTAVKKRKL